MGDRSKKWLSFGCQLGRSRAKKPCFPRIARGVTSEGDAGHIQKLALCAESRCGSFAIQAI
jgi:hypothetical protein